MGSMIVPVIEAVEKSDAFCKWQEAHPEGYLAHVFVFVENDVPNGWQIGYVEGENVVPFLVNGDDVAQGESSEVFKKPDSKIMKLDVDSIKLTVIEAVAKAREHQEEKFPREQGQKAICILQDLPEVGQVWNITFITMTMKTLNIKVDASTGDIKSAKLVSLFDFVPGTKGKSDEK